MRGKILKLMKNYYVMTGNSTEYMKKCQLVQQLYRDNIEL